MVFLRSVRRLLVAASVVPSSPILVTLMNEALGSSETSVLKEPRGVTSQKTAFLNEVTPCGSCRNIKNTSAPRLST
jgi:hypothetical protein